MNTQTGDLRSPEPPKNGHSGDLRSPAQTPLRPPTLREAVAALPAKDGGDLTREGLLPLLESGDLHIVLGRTINEITSLRSLVEVLRCAATETEAPVADTLAGIGALSDHVRERLRRVQSILQGVAGEVKTARRSEIPS